MGKINVRDALAAAAAIRTGQLAGQSQGMLQRRQNEADDYNRSFSAWQTGHNLENEGLAREDAADQVLVDAANLMEPDDPHRAQYLGTALKNRDARTKRKRQYGPHNMPVMPGMERLFSPAPASDPGATASPSPQGAPAGTVVPPGTGAAAGVVGPTAPAGQPTPPPTAALGPDGKPLPPPPQYSPEQVAIMQSTLGQVAHLIPGGRAMVDMLNMADAGQMLPGQPNAPGPQPAAAPPPETGMVEGIGGLPPFQLGGQVSEADAKATGERVKAGVDFIKKLGLDMLDPTTRGNINLAMSTLPASFTKKGDLAKGQAFLTLVQPLMAGGDLALRSRMDAENDKKTTGFKDRMKGLDDLDPAALTTELPSLYDEMESTRANKEFHGTLPASLQSSKDDIQKIRDLHAQAEAARTAGDTTTADDLDAKAQDYAKMVRGRVRAKKSTQEENHARQAVRQLLANASSAQRHDPAAVRAIYKQAGADWLAERMTDEELTAGGGAEAEKAYYSMLGRFKQMARLGKTGGQDTFLAALGQAAKEAGMTVDVPAELVEQMTPLEMARLRNYNQQFKINGDENSRKNAQLKIGLHRFDWQRYKDREQIKKWQASGTGKGSILTQNEKVRSARTDAKAAEDDLVRFLSAIKNPEGDEKTMTPAERKAYHQKQARRHDTRRVWTDTLYKAGGPRLSMDAGDDGPGVDIPQDQKARKPQKPFSEMSAQEFEDYTRNANGR